MQVGDLQFFHDEQWLAAAFASCSGVVATKVQRAAASGAAEGYGFVTFASRAEADAALRLLGAPGGGLRLAWAQQASRRSFSGLDGPSAPQPGAPGGAVGSAAAPFAPPANEFSLFVGDVSPDVTDALLADCFRQRYPATRSAKVVTDAATGRSKGFGFVRFASGGERDEALHAMNGVVLCGRPMRISLAAPKKTTPPPPLAGPGAGIGGGMRPGAAAAAASAYFHGGGAFMPSQGAHHHQAGLDGAVDPSNTTVFVGGLDAAVTEEELRSVFERFGEMVYVKIPHGKNCGFVQFVHRHCAEAAIAGANGATVGRQQVRLSWGRSNSGRGAMAAAAAAAASYGYGGYGGYGGYYGYAQPQPQPGAYYAYPGYGYENWGAQMAAVQYAQQMAAAAQGYGAGPSMGDMTSSPQGPVPLPLPVPMPAPRAVVSKGDAPPAHEGVDAATDALRAMLLMGTSSGPPAELADADA